MGPQCLSACGPCKQVCNACVNSYNRSALEETRKAVQNVRRLLESQGYTVIAPELLPVELEAIRVLTETNQL